MDDFDRWQYERMMSCRKGESMEKADARFEKWLNKKKVREEMKRNPSLYRRKKCTEGLR